MQREIMNNWQAYCRSIVAHIILFILIGVSFWKGHLWGMTIGLLILYVIWHYEKIKLVLDTLGIKKIWLIDIHPTRKGDDSGTPSAEHQQVSIVTSTVDRSKAVDADVSEWKINQWVLKELQEQTGEYFYPEMTVEGTDVPSYRFDGLSVDKERKCLTGVEVLVLKRHASIIIDRIHRDFMIGNSFIESGNKYGRHSRFILAIVHCLEEPELISITKTIQEIRRNVKYQPEIMWFPLEDLKSKYEARK